MNIVLEPWHWFVLGIALILLELFLSTFAILWFGIAAVMVSLLFWLSPWMSTALQILIWAIFSIANTILWFKFIRPITKRHQKNASDFKELIGQTGIVIQVFSKEKHEIKVRFSIPLLGHEEWTSQADQPVNVGDRIEIIGFKENKFIVTPHLNIEARTSH